MPNSGLNVVVALGRDLDLDAVAFARIGADEGEGRIAATHLAFRHVEDAATGSVNGVEVDLVQSLTHALSPQISNCNLVGKL